MPESPQNYSKKLMAWQTDRTSAQLAQSLHVNKVSITSTDTIYGFLGSLSEQSVQTIHNLKGRDENKPFIILIASAGKVTHFVDPANLTPDIKRLITHCWPGPVTIIFKADPSVPHYLTGPDGTVALRCPKHAGLLQILPQFEGLVSTSANKAGKPAPQRLEDIDPDLINGSEYVVFDANADKASQPHLPSSIIDVSGVYYTAPRVVREGAYSIQELEQMYGKPFIR